MNLNPKKLKLIAPSLLLCAVATGCHSANKKSTTPQASAIPPMNQAALNVPATPPPPAAPAATFTPTAPAQPVVYDPAAEQPVVAEAVADASDSVAPVTRSRPRKPASPASASRAGGGTKYKVKKGDSLWSIAETRYGNGNKWKQIAAANPKLDPNHVEAGQTITLP